MLTRFGSTVLLYSICKISFRASTRSVLKDFSVAVELEVGSDLLKEMFKWLNGQAMTTCVHTCEKAP